MRMLMKIPLFSTYYLGTTRLKALNEKRENAVEGSDEEWGDYSAKGEPAMQKIEDSWLRHFDPTKSFYHWILYRWHRYVPQKL